MIRLKHQIGNLKTEVIYHVIDADTSYNLLLNRKTWLFHRIMYQCLKYIDGLGVVKTVSAQKHIFKWVENYFIDSNLY